MKTVQVVGGGLAGCEAAVAIARRGIPVRLIEMRPVKSGPAHQTGNLAELVCSNSLRSDNPTNAVGLLKREMAYLGSPIIDAALEARIPAGDALAVDRELFARAVHGRIAAHPGIELVREEVTAIPDSPAVIACGPLPPEAFTAALGERFGDTFLSFYDAIAPAVWADSIDRDKAFAQSRYGKGGGDDYLNCPFDREGYDAFIEAVRTGERVPEKKFENLRRFEGCIPIEVMVDRGPETLRHGPMKPVGLVDPRTGEQPHAVVQLRADDVAGEVWNLVGFQSKLSHSEQKRIFRMIPGLEQARFVRLGTLHRNTFLTAPEILAPTLEVKGSTGLFLAGQITGVEGYVESAALGMLAGINVAAHVLGEEAVRPPATTALGGLIRHLTESQAKNFQPANINLGLLPPVPGRLKKPARREEAARRAVRDLRAWVGGWPEALRGPEETPETLERYGEVDPTGLPVGSMRALG